MNEEVSKSEQARPEEDSPARAGELPDYLDLRDHSRLPASEVSRLCLFIDSRRLFLLQRKGETFFVTQALRVCTTGRAIEGRGRMRRSSLYAL